MKGTYTLCIAIAVVVWLLVILATGYQTVNIISATVLSGLTYTIFHFMASEMKAPS
ncbi:MULTISPECIES: hypothetical protein [Shouchella]|uniref:Uncharacterized protein n=3 Tax=Shouchella TaxID=2893057 RepID=A0A060M0U1_9BACI|nr:MULTISPECIES: hypothetical protein [Bacillaceae]AIC96052.1 hypothetical protein BleG1_3505 [Shouchella lehensis G1]MED4129426.1 hypothetical protein [Shouchella miscanthi]WDF04857.1 hypothetical protein PQ477_05190 [Shouchella hunanensis]GAF23642.1 hypothetical protein JCM19047_3476 [Bacillus sp. JCM 19047]